MNAAPILATAEQLAAEATLRRFLADPEVQAALKSEEKRLRAHPLAQTKDGSAHLTAAIHAWASGLALGWNGSDPANPAILLSVDNTPRHWLGQDVPALGAAGDNPDHVYRGATLDGRGRYEIHGKLDLNNRPSQIVFELVRGTPGQMTLSSAASSKRVSNHVDIITDKEIEYDEDGSFVLRIDDAEAGPNHLRTVPEPLRLIIRDVLGDWRQAPSQLAIKRLDQPAAAPMPYEALKRAVLEKLPGYIDFWMNFPSVWMGGVPVNEAKGPVQRDGGFGYQAGFRFKLEPGDVMVLTLKKGAVGYLGVQISGPYFLAPDARLHTTSLNDSQARPNPDGTYTYVVSAEDPGVFNWLDTAGIHEGLGVVRWQAVPAGERVSEYLVEARKLNRAAFERDYAKLPRISPAERLAQRKEHGAQYSLRFQR